MAADGRAQQRERMRSVGVVMNSPVDDGIGQSRFKAFLQGLEHAIGTSSWASGNVYGRRDHGITRDEALAHARAISGATDLPVSADFENGFGATPREVAETYRQAAVAGLTAHPTAE